MSGHGFPTAQKLLADTLAVPDGVRQSFDTVARLVEETLTAGRAEPVTGIYLAGSGDLHHAALATELAFERSAGLRAEATSSMPLGLYAAPTLPPGSVLIQMSFSGKTARAVEAATLARAAGAKVWAITNDGGSPLAELGDLRFAKPDTGPNEAAGYPITMLILHLIAVRLGELRGHLSAGRAAELRAELRAAPDDMRATLELCHDTARALGERFKDTAHVLFLGSGSHFGTAQNGAARVLEARGANATAQDVEEWVHLQRWVREKETPCVLIAPPGPSRDRAREVLDALGLLGRPRIAIVAEDDVELGTRADAHLPVRCRLGEELSPLVYYLPGELFADYLSIASGEPPFRAGDPAYDRVGEIRWGGFIRTSPESAPNPGRTSEIEERHPT